MLIALDGRLSTRCCLSCDRKRSFANFTDTARSGRTAEGAASGVDGAVNRSPTA
jgi:hypothetical protein